MHNVVSVDGFIADDNDDIGPLFDWYFNGDQPLAEGSGFTVSQASADYVRPLWGSIGAMVIGRRLFDLMNGWDGQPPTGDHVVVVSHRPKPEGWHPEASYHFVGDGRRCGETRPRSWRGPGRRGRGRRRGWPGAGEGLVDEVAMDVVPVVFGSGRRYFGPVDSQHLLEDPDVVVQGDRVLHLRYRVRRG